MAAPRGVDRRRIIDCFRETMRRARHLGGERGHSLRLDAHAAFDNLRRAAEPGRLAAAVSAVESRLAYLRMITPRYAGRKGEQAAEGLSGAAARESYVVRDGKLQARERSSGVQHSVQSSFTGSNIDPEALRRHERLIERQHFGGEYWQRRGQASPPRSPLAR